MMTWVRVVVLLLVVGCALPVRAQDRLLEEAVDFTGAILYHTSGAPGVIIGAVRNGKTAVAGFGRARSDGSSRAPDGDTLMRIGSITKVFAGTVLASLVADGTVRLSDRLDKHLSWNVRLPSRETSRRSAAAFCWPRPTAAHARCTGAGTAGSG
jgi:D-alanyl-D-alanine-carboxypeptidase/D-alanyl-D-alanine-endopeptidase